MRILLLCGGVKFMKRLVIVSVVLLLIAGGAWGCYSAPLEDGGGDVSVRAEGQPIACIAVYNT